MWRGFLGLTVRTLRPSHPHGELPKGRGRAGLSPPGTGLDTEAASTWAAQGPLRCQDGFPSRSLGTTNGQMARLQVPPPPHSSASCLLLSRCPEGHLPPTGTHTGRGGLADFSEVQLGWFSPLLGREQGRWRGLPQAGRGPGSGFLGSAGTHAACWEGSHCPSSTLGPGPRHRGSSPLAHPVSLVTHSEEHG